MAQSLDMKTLYLILFIACCDIALGQSIVRGPYLNIGTSNSIVVRWRTDVPVIGKVLFGTVEGSQTSAASETSTTTEHVVTITGLNPATKYFYTLTDLNDQVYQTNDSLRYFQTAPIPGSREPITIWAIGDFGTGGAGQIGTRNGYRHFTNNQHTDVWLWLGDNAYSDGTDQEYQDKVFDIYPDQLKNSVAWPCPGNHDYKSINVITNTGPYYDMFSLPENGEAGGVASGEEGYYSFDYGNVHFVSLNSEYVVWFLTGNSQMVSWLRQDLAQNDKDFTIVYWHKPTYSKGSHDSDELGDMTFLRSIVNPVLEEFGVDLVLQGHSHGYERSYLLKGHFGTSTSFNANMIVDTAKGSPAPFVKYHDAPNVNQGTIYNVVGCSGQLSSSGSMNHPANYFSSNLLNGSLVITVDSNLLVAHFIDTSGNILDEYKILKQSIRDTITSLIGFASLKDIVQVFPNPADRQLSVQLSSHAYGFYVVELIALDGSIASTRHIKTTGGMATTQTLDVSHLPHGSYMLRVHKEGAEDFVKRLVIFH
jgi:acid phosphatase type 7